MFIMAYWDFTAFYLFGDDYNLWLTYGWLSG